MCCSKENGGKSKNVKINNKVRKLSKIFILELISEVVHTAMAKMTMYKNREDTKWLPDLIL